VQVVLSLHHPIISSTATHSSSAPTDTLPPRTPRHQGDTIYLGFVSEEGIAVTRLARGIALASAAGRATRAIDPRNPGFLATHCGDAARRAGRCDCGVYGVTMGLVGWAWGSRGEGTEEAWTVG
jgi:hypothetical protein